jgi:hypothetical protein
MLVRCCLSMFAQARFKYPPHWVPLPMLYEAMGAIDPATGQPRGYLRLSANVRPDSVLFTLDIRPDGSWREAEAFIQSTAPQLVQVCTLCVVSSGGRGGGGGDDCETGGGGL